jgi:hypothetical protein
MVLLPAASFKFDLVGGPGFPLISGAGKKTNLLMLDRN